MGNSSPMGLPLYFSIWREGAFEEEFEGVADHVGPQRERLEGALVQEVGTVGVAVEVAYLRRSRGRAP